MTAHRWLALAACCGLVACSDPGAAPEGGAASVERVEESGFFAELPAGSGFDFVHVNAMTGAYRFVEMMGGGAAMVDLDGDGDLDLYLVQGARLDPEREPLAPFAHPEPLTDRVYLNRLAESGELRFDDVTAASALPREHGMGVAAGDVDNDGDLDLYVTAFGPNRLLENLGGGRFRDVTDAAGVGELRWSVPAVFFDYDRDGWLDLYVGNYVDLSLGSEKSCFADTGARDYCGPAAYPGESDRLFRNLGGGRFDDVTGAAGLLAVASPALGAVAGDFDGDGWPDLYVANDGEPNQLWRNRGGEAGGGPIFEESALFAGVAVNADGMPEASMGVVAADLDADGDEDLFLTHLQRETNTLYLNDGTGLFTDRSRPSGLGAASIDATGFGAGALDVDNDGHLDVLTVNGAVRVLDEQVVAGSSYPLAQRDQLFRGLGAGRFEEATEAAGGAFGRLAVSRGAAFGDVDDDGDADVLVVDSNAPARMLINRVGQDRGWIGLRVLDPAGRDAEGAWVGVFATGRPTAWRRVRTGGSYASASDPRVLVGLGDARAVERVEVRWPGGEIERWDELEIGRYHTLRQGEGPP